jgi:hypothetical protein
LMARCGCKRSNCGMSRRIPVEGRFRLLNRVEIQAARLL